MSRSWTITLNPPADWLNSNQRHKRRPDIAIAAWRGLSSALAEYARIPRVERCRITADLRWPDRRRRDSGNYMPTIKCAIDGIVDAGVLIDDDDTHVVELLIRRGEPVASRARGMTQGALTITVTELDEVSP